jgi:hypothetical protein
MLLGGLQGGECHLERLAFGNLNSVQCIPATPNNMLNCTIVGLLSLLTLVANGTQVANVSQAKSQAERYRLQLLSFMLTPREFNNNVPENVKLICGDPNLEIIAPALANEASKINVGENLDNFKQTVLALHRSLHGTEFISDPGRPFIVLIDTNPSFSIFTQISLCAADRLIIPVKADESSRVSMRALFALLYGSDLPHSISSRYEFSHRVTEQNIDLPRIHFIIGSQMTQHKFGAATLFKFVTRNAVDEMFHYYRIHPNRFSGLPDGVILQDETDFKARFYVDLRDFNISGVVAGHLGKPVRDLKTEENVYGTQISLTADTIEDGKTAVLSVVNLL